MTAPTLDPATRALFYRYDRALPLNAETTVVADSKALRIERFAISSRHDARVPGLFLHNPNAGEPRPTVLIAHPATLDKSSDYVMEPARAWVERGAICVTIDQAGHGERRDGALDVRESLRSPVRRADESVQTAVDWMRTVDYIIGRPEVDAERIGFAGFSLGGMRGAAFVGLDARVKASVFAICGAAGSVRAQVKGDDADAIAASLAITDPLHFAPLIAPRAALVLAGRQDDYVPPESTQAFFDALGDPKAIQWLDCGHFDFWPQGLAPIWPFLESHL